MTRASTRRYLLALCSVATLSLLACITMQWVIGSHRQSAAVINRAGRQRMLSQRIALYALDWAQAEPARRPLLRDGLAAALESFARSHEELSLGSDALGAPSALLRDVYFGEAALDRDARAFIDKTRALLAQGPDGESSRALAAELRDLAENGLLPRLDLVVSLDQRENEEQVARLRAFEVLILAFTLLLLGVEAFFIFRPMVASISELLELALEARDTAVRATDAKSAFLATITHEIRNPMSGIVGILDSLLDAGAGPPSTQRAQLETIRRLANSLVLMVNDVLDHSKIEAGQMSLEMIEFDLAALESDAQTLFASSAVARGITLAFERDAALPTLLQGDPTRLRQVVTNFIGNAIKFTPQGGSIRVAFRSIAAAAGKVGLRVEVQDSGVGVPQEAQGRLFTRFAQASASVARSHGGTGLGLSICKQIIEQMQGRIGFDSVAGKGSLFWFELALDACRSKPAQAAAEDDAAPWAVGLHALLAEDTEVNRLVISAQLKRLGFEVKTAADGRAAVTAVREGRFDVVLMDCEMPVLDGFEATREIRRQERAANAAAVPIVAMTGHSGDDKKQAGLEAGMTAFLTKPVRREALSAALRALLEPALVRLAS